MNSYHKIVFGLKYNHDIYKCQASIKLMDSVNIIISEHDANTDNCEYPGLHYHGIIENAADNSNNDGAFVLLRMYCTYLKVELCSSPEQFVADLVQPPKKIIFLDIWKSVNLTTFYSNVPDFAVVRLESSKFVKESLKMSDIRSIVETIKSRRIYDPVEIRKYIEMENYYWSPPNELDRLVIDSIALVRQMILNQPILELCNRCLKWSENYFTVKESADLIVEWCQDQNIDVATFTRDLVSCLDKRAVLQNSLYFEGASDSGILPIIHSIADACVYAGKVDNESTGYTYVWEESLEKRCIIMRDPAFDESMFKELEDILKGIGTLVPHRKYTMKYLCRTPVIIVCTNDYPDRDLYLKRLQDSFLGSYVKLKPCMKLHKATRLLHPDWLNLLYHFYFGCVTDNPENTMADDDSYVDYMESSNISSLYF